MQNMVKLNNALLKIVRRLFLKESYFYSVIIKVNAPICNERYSIVQNDTLQITHV